MPLIENLAINLALNWLSESDIRIKDHTNVAFGGICQGYNWKNRTYPFVYSEITGYAISAFMSAYRWTSERKYLDLAIDASDYLIRVQASAEQDNEFGAIPHGFSLPNLKLTRLYYSFDAAMCLQGLLDLYSIQPTSERRDSAQAIGDWLIEKMQNKDGSFLAMYDSYNSQRNHDNNNFFDDFGCLQAKNAIGLIKLSKILKDDKYTFAAQKVCDWVIKLQNPNGAIRANNWMKRTVSHSHCYAAEGLLYAGTILHNDRYISAAKKGGEWLINVQNSDGSINIEYNRPLWRKGRRVFIDTLFPKRVTDATAQAIRIWLLLFHMNGDQVFLNAAKQSATYLENMQNYDQSDKNGVGAFYFWKGHPVMYTWATMFAINALHALYNIERVDAYENTLIELY